jgi:hypothetical protein
MRTYEVFPRRRQKLSKTSSLILPPKHQSNYLPARLVDLLVLVSVHSVLKESNPFVRGPGI